MKTSVAIYNSHKNAIDAVKILNEEDFPMKKVSVIGKVELVDDEIKVRSLKHVKNAPAYVGVVAGSVIGLLSGIGVFMIPGFGFLYGAGALIGTIGGFDLGLISGGLLTLLTTIGIKDDYAVKYQQHIEAGNFLVVVQGSDEEIDRAEEILQKSHLLVENPVKTPV